MLCCCGCRGCCCPRGLVFVGVFAVAKVVVGRNENFSDCITPQLQSQRKHCVGVLGIGWKQMGSEKRRSQEPEPRRHKEETTCQEFFFA